MVTTVLGTIPVGVASAVSWAANVIAVLCVIPLCWTTLPAAAVPRALAGNGLATRLWALREKTAPQPATWGIWAAAGIIGSAGMAIAGAPPSAWSLKLALSIGPLAVAYVARYLAGVPWMMNRWDGLCLLLAGIGLGFLLFGEGLAALWLSIAVNIVGTPPTVMHALKEPWKESYFPFACAFVSVAAVLLLAIPVPWTVASSAYGLYLLIDVTVIMSAIAIGRSRARARGLGPDSAVYADHEAEPKW